MEEINILFNTSRVSSHSPNILQYGKRTFHIYSVPIQNACHARNRHAEPSTFVALPGRNPHRHRGPFRTMHIWIALSSLSHKRKSAHVQDANRLCLAICRRHTFFTYSTAHHAPVCLEDGSTFYSANKCGRCPPHHRD